MQNAKANNLPLGSDYQTSVYTMNTLNVFIFNLHHTFMAVLSLKSFKYCISFCIPKMPNIRTFTYMANSLLDLRHLESCITSLTIRREAKLQKNL